MRDFYTFRMSTNLTNGFGNSYLSIDYDAANGWVYNRWVGYQTYIGIVAGADSCLHTLRENNCAYLLNDNREVVGPWDHAVGWIVNDWAPRAVAQGLTHFANVVSPESLAALSAKAMYQGVSTRLQMRMFATIEEAQVWLRDAQRTQL